MSDKKPQPLFMDRVRERCPVCGETSYSLAGIHPQCAVRQADAERVRKIKSEKAALAEAEPAPRSRAWHRDCPKCSTPQHIRKKSCVCGHIFDGHHSPVHHKGTS